MQTVLEKVLIRGCEVKTSRINHQYILVRFENLETAEAGKLVDKNLDRKELYVKDKIMNLYLEINPF